MQLLFPFGESGAQRRGEAFAIRKTIHTNIDIKKCSQLKPQQNTIFRRILRLIHRSFRGLYWYINPRKRLDLNASYA